MRARMRVLERQADAPRYLAEDMAEDVLDRLSFLRHQPQRALVVGDTGGYLAAALEAQGCAVVRADPAPLTGELAIDEELPFPDSGLEQGFDLIAQLGTLGTVNDLPGAMLHIRRALAPDGLAADRACAARAASLPCARSWPKPMATARPRASTRKSTCAPGATSSNAAALRSR
jgi:SAM-dependent methyltransferase